MNPSIGLVLEEKYPSFNRKFETKESTPQRKTVTFLHVVHPVIYSTKLAQF